MALDKTKIKQSFANASLTYDNVAQLQRNVGCDLLQAFLQKHLTGIVLDLGCGTGFLTQTLLPHCSGADLVALDLALPMLHTTREKLNDSVHYICADAEQLPFTTQNVQTVFSNLALQWCLPLDNALNELHRILKSDGELIFSIFGSQTLCELKSAWAKVDDYAHVNEFYTLKQLQVLLENAGFVDIEMSNSNYVSRYDSVLALMHELKHIGAHNVNTQRSKTLTTKKALKTMMAHYPSIESDDIVATFEVITVRARKKIR